MKKKGLLVVSFGTAYGATRKKTIEALEQQLWDSFPDYERYRAWTSGRIVKKVMQEEGLHIDLLEEAMERMLGENIETLLIQPTYVMKGAEYDRTMEIIGRYADSFGQIRVGETLLAAEEDFAYMTGVMQDSFPQVTEEDALILMGHGTPGGDNSCYERMNLRFRENGYRNYHIGLVEGNPGINSVMDEMQGLVPGKVYLAPFMLVAGNHALKDMSGEEPNSWQNLLKSRGYQTECVIRGLGEYPKVRALFVQHARDAIQWRKQ